MADIAASDVTYTVSQYDVDFLPRHGQTVIGSLVAGNGTLTYDPSTGIPLSKGQLGGVGEIVDFKIRDISKSENVEVRFDKDSQCLRVYEGVNGTGNSTITIQDDDCASCNGTALYVLDLAASPNVAENKFLTAFLSANANNADAAVRFGQYGPEAIVEDDDCAACNGVAVYLDEGDNKLIAAISRDLYVPLSDGSYFKIYADASAACNGVAVYFDDNASNDYERLLATTAGNADDTVSQELANGEICPRLEIDFVSRTK